MDLIKVLIVGLISVSVATVAYLYGIEFMIRMFKKVKTISKQIFKKEIEKKRLKKIDAELVDGINMLANGLKAGLSLQQSIEMASVDGPKCLAEEFRKIIDQIKIGLTLEEALLSFKERNPLEDVDITIDAIVVLRKTGGNLIETFKLIAETIRERGKVKGKIKVLTSQGIAQAVVILLLPFVIAAGLAVVAPWYIAPLFSEPLGLALILFGLALQTVGAFWMKRIVKIRV